MLKMFYCLCFDLVSVKYGKSWKELDATSEKWTWLRREEWFFRLTNSKVVNGRQFLKRNQRRKSSTEILTWQENLVKSCSVIIAIYHWLSAASKSQSKVFTSRVSRHVLPNQYPLFGSKIRTLSLPLLKQELSVESGLLWIMFIGILLFLLIPFDACCFLVLVLSLWR